MTNLTNKLDPTNESPQSEERLTTPLITMTRRVTFSAAHIVANSETRHAATDPNTGILPVTETSGHNYSLDVCVTGIVDGKTGIVVNIKDIDLIVRREVIMRLDGRLLNGKGGPMEGSPASGEALLEYIREALLPHLPACVVLTSLRLEKTAVDAYEWRSGEGKQHRPSGCLVTRVYEFSASHRLHSRHLTDKENQDLFGKCNYTNGHGHNYVVEITVSGTPDAVTGQVVDTVGLDQIVHREVVDRYDHRHLNLDIPEFQDTIPSSELVTKVIWDRLIGNIPEPARLYRVLVRETARNIFEYYGED